MINEVTLVGSLGQNPKAKTLESGAVVAGFSLATSENYQDRNGEWQENTEWHDVVMWRKLAERATEHLKTGDLIYLKGKLTKRKWRDNEDQPRSKVEVVASYFRRLNKRDNNYLPSEEPQAPQVSPASDDFEDPPF